MGREGKARQAVTILSWNPHPGGQLFSDAAPDESGTPGQARGDEKGGGGSVLRLDFLKWEGCTNPLLSACQCLLKCRISLAMSE